MTNNQLTEAELTETLDAATSGYPLTASAEANLRRVFAELQERRKPLLDKDLQGVLGALEHPAGINAAGKRVVRSALVELQERRKAAMDSEPVAYTDERNLSYIDRGRETAYLWGKQNSEASDVALYRHAQPAPVVPEEMPCGGAADDYHDGYQDGWNACRAAMLQAGDAVRDLSTPVDPQVADYEQNVMQAGNSPVIPDGYVMVPVKPTREILDEFDSIIDYGAEDSEDAWRRLLAAAPKEVKGE
ncbi:hypothetical protein ACU6ZK_02195 [Klebsiella aerogenes]